MKKLLIIIFALLSFSAFSQTENTCFPSTRPGISMGVYPVGLDNSSLEFGFMFDKHNIPIQNVSYSVNFIKNLQFVECVSKIGPDINNISMLKYTISLNSKILPDIAFLGSYSKDYGSLALLAQKSFGSVTLIGNYTLDNYKHDLYSFCAGYNITNDLIFSAEVFGSSTISTKYTSGDAGLFYFLNKNLGIDFSIYYNNFKTYSINTGISFRFK